MSKDPLEELKEITSFLLMGGYWQIELDTVYLLDSRAQCWKQLKITLPHRMESFGAALVNDEIYIFGGIYYKDYYQTCYKLKADGTWLELAPLNEKRSGISSASLVYFGDIWIIGGCQDEKSLKSIEKYTISEDKWSQMPELNQGRYDAAAAIYKNKIVVTGGFGAERSVELFDPELQKWLFFCDLPIGNFGHCMTVIDSILTIYGGYSGTSPLNVVWEMDLEDADKKWTQKGGLKYNRRNFGIVKLSTGIMAIGGGPNTTEIFDGKKWTEGARFPQGKEYFAFTAIPRYFEESLLEKFT